MEKNSIYFLITLFIFLLFGCDVPGEFANKKFADQHFKTVIAAVELHNIRYGRYPDSLGELKFTGDWDQLAFQSVEYHKLPKGYELNIGKGFTGKADLSYPKEFWQGLGMVKSNVKGFE